MIDTKCVICGNSESATLDMDPSDIKGELVGKVTCDFCKSKYIATYNLTDIIFLEEYLGYLDDDGNFHSILDREVER